MDPRIHPANSDRSWDSSERRAAGGSRQNGAVEQRIAWAILPDGTRVAYATSGAGQFLVYAPGWLTHLELSWAMPQERAFCEALSEGRTLLRYDRPGCGLSDRDGRPPSMERELQTLEAV